MKNTFLTITFLLLSLNSFSQNWIEVTKDKFGNKFYIKSSIVSKGGDLGIEDSVIKIWLKKTEKKITDQRSKSKRKVYYNAYMLKLMEFDCKNTKSRTLSITGYSSSGVVLGTESIDYAEWEYIVPDSVGEILLEKVCELYNN